jgi:hypothetical protein
MVRTVLDWLVVRGTVIVRESDEDGIPTSVRSGKLLEGGTTFVRVCGVTVPVRGRTVVRMDSDRWTVVDLVEGVTTVPRVSVRGETVVVLRPVRVSSVGRPVRTVDSVCVDVRGPT